MQHSDFKLGLKFTVSGTRDTWLVTDVGTRTVIAVCLTVSNKNDYARSLPLQTQERIWTSDPSNNPTIDPSWLSGPPYALAEHVFDESDIPVCEVIK